MGPSPDTPGRRHDAEVAVAEPEFPPPGQTHAARAALVVCNHIGDDPAKGGRLKRLASCPTIRAWNRCTAGRRRALPRPEEIIEDIACDFDPGSPLGQLRPHRS